MSQEPHVSAQERRETLLACGFNVEQFSDADLADVPQDFEVLPKNTIRRSVMSLYATHVMKMEEQMISAHPSDWFGILQSNCWNAAFQQRLHDTIFIFSGKLLPYVINVAYKMWLLDDERKNGAKAVAPFAREAIACLYMTPTTARGRGASHAGRSTRATESGTIGWTLSLPSRVLVTKGLEVVTASSMADVFRIADAVGAKQFHGTGLRESWSVAEKVNLDRGLVPSEFSWEPAFYTTSDPIAAVLRANEKHPDTPQGIAMFGPVDVNIFNLSLFTFDAGNSRDIVLWRQLIWKCCNDDAYMVDNDALLNAHIVRGPICIQQRAQDISMIGAYRADQTGYLTSSAVEALCTACIKVVVELSADFAYPARLDADPRV
ncbi:hypothetical protein HDU87_002123 [Geranomyces variabilis]|uniref:Uncharacterized protein n=1 Tax=Geranomyces variabilis TaxID=109894 RepID=A0AAD5XNG2_9FUNG|nr:hypothetical protein HDU87_002123 [Geranomyces variabilis]